MKVVFLGSTQIKHIEKVFAHCGYKVTLAEQKTSGIVSKIKFFLKVLNNDIIYHVGGIDVEKVTVFKVARLLGKKVVVHWIGTDVLTYTKRYKETHKKINGNCINLSGSPLLQSELREIGIESFVLPIVPTDFSFKAQKMPDKHAVLAYIPETREEFYNIALLKSMAKRFPELDFHIVANTGKNALEPLSNVKYHGFLNSDEMFNLYEQCSILFRYPQHDGLSMMLLEALGYGKNVIYCYEFPFVETPRDSTPEEVSAAFEKILSMPPKVNSQAVDFVNSEFSLEKQIQRYKDAAVF